jgi:hypothetical protein
MNYFQYLFIFIIKTKDTFGQILVRNPKCHMRCYRVKQQPY